MRCNAERAKYDHENLYTLMETPRLGGGKEETKPPTSRTLQYRFRAPVLLAPPFLCFSILPCRVILLLAPPLPPSLTSHYLWYPVVTPSFLLGSRIPVSL